MAASDRKLFILLINFITYIYLVNSDSLKWRLPKSIRPVKYKIHVTVPEESLTDRSNKYFGRVVIDMQAKESTKRIKLHASRKEFIKLDTISLSGTVIERGNYTLDETTEILTISAPFDIKEEQLVIDYTALLNVNEWYGFYKSTYTDKGETKHMVTTMMEPTYARRTFPCFDEPSFKAVFQVNLTYPKGFNALSNTPGTLIADDGKLETVMFEETTTISTYLVAFVISKMNCLEGNLNGYTPYRICSRYDVSEATAWPLEIASKIWSVVQSYTDYSYLNKSMPKLDEVAVPEFDYQAMENWGLTTYNELLLLWHEEDNTVQDKKNIAMMMSNQISHIWFGNLITCDWWSFLFLNSAIPKWSEFFLIDHAFPSWELDKQYVVEVLLVTFREDCLKASPALETEVNSPDDAESLFTGLIDYKGSAVMNMLFNVMGDEAFRDGIRQHIKQFEHSTVQPDDFWNSMAPFINSSLTKFPDKSLTKIMENWVKLPGYPLLTVTVSGSDIKVKQERLRLIGEDLESKWYIPICYSTSEIVKNIGCNKDNTFWLSPTKESSFKVERKNRSSWFIINNYKGYYRVNYDDKTWMNIGKALKQLDFGGIPVINRAILVDDLFISASIGKVNYEVVFQVLEFLANETSYYTWIPISSSFLFMVDNFGLNSALGQAIARRYVELQRKMYDSVDFRTENHEDEIYNLKQYLAIFMACKMQSVDCFTQARLHFKMYKEQGIMYVPITRHEFVPIGHKLKVKNGFPCLHMAPHKNIRETVYCYGLKNSKDKNDYNFLFGELAKAKTVTEKVRISNGLACFLDTNDEIRYFTFRKEHPRRNFNKIYKLVNLLEAKGCTLVSKN